VVVTVFGVALVIWGCVSALRGSLLAGCVTLLVVGCCCGAQFIDFEVGSLTLTLDRVLAAGLVGAYVLRRWLGQIDRKPIAGAELPLAALLTVLAVSTFTADWRHAGVGHAPPLWRFYAGYALPAVVYWLARQSPLTERSIGATFTALMGFAIYLAATGVFEVTQQWWLVFPGYIADPERGLAFGRARGPMLHPVSFGLYVGVGMFSAYLWGPRRGGAGRWLGYASLPLFLAALFLTYTRSVWLGSGLGVFTVLALTLPRYWRAPVLAAMVAVGAFVATTQWNALLDARWRPQASRHSASRRLSLAYVSWRMFLDRPWFGVHFGHFPEAKVPYLADQSTSLDLKDIRHMSQHNLFLSLLTETGVVGLSLFLTVLWCWVCMGWQVWCDPRAPDWVRMAGALLLATVVIYVCQWLFNELSFAPTDHGLLFLVAGITAGVRSRATRVC